MSDTSDSAGSGQDATGSPDGGTPPPPRRRLRWPRRRFVALVLAALLVVFSAATARLFIWPDLPPLPGSADAIVQLGGPGNRRMVALELARQGRAPVVAISVSTDEIDTSWCDEGRLRDVAVICFHPQPFTTRGEARYLTELASQHGWRSVILVTTPDQAWRATVRVRRCYDGEIYVATARLPRHRWPVQLVYQWGATAKAFTLELSC